MQASRYIPPGEVVILDSDNATSSCLAASSSTWWQGHLEAAAANTARHSSIAFCLTPEDLVDLPEIDVVMSGIFDNQLGAAAFDLEFGIYIGRIDLDLVASHAVQNVVGPLSQPLRHGILVPYTPGAGAALGMWEYRCRIWFPTARTINFDANSMVWKTAFCSEATTCNTLGAADAAAALSNAVRTEPHMGFSNRSHAAGLRITPYFRKAAASDVRMLHTNCMIVPRPLNNRETLSLRGRLGV